MSTDSQAAARLADTAARSLFSGDRASQALGISILDIAPGSVRIAMTVREDMLNGHGTAHGGVIFTLADSAFALACNSRAEAMVGAGASIEYLAPTYAGANLIATASEVLRTERHGIYDVAVATDSGQVVAHFRGRCARQRATSTSSSPS